MKNLPWVVYIIYSKSWDKYYTGISQNLEDRLLRHNQGRNKSTRGGNPWILKFSETFPSRSDALARETYIKARKSRSFLEKLISIVG